MGEGWERLCSFLGHPVPPTPWPHENRAGSKGNIVERMVELLLLLLLLLLFLKLFFFLLISLTPPSSTRWSSQCTSGGTGRPAPPSPSLPRSPACWRRRSGISPCRTIPEPYKTAFSKEEHQPCI